MSKWCKIHYNDGTLFDVPFLCKELGMNPDSRSDYNSVYNAIKYWRTEFINFYTMKKKIGFIDGMNRYEAWNIMLDNYNKNDSYVFLGEYDKSSGCYYFIQPNFDKLESMDRRRLIRQWKGIGTVIDEMITVDARLVLSDGSYKPVKKLLESGKDVTKMLTDDEKQSE